jgi:hypothetical protein
MQERSVQIDGVVMAAAFLPKDEHPTLPEVSHDAPDGSFG